MKCPIFRQQWLRMAAPQLDQADECIKEECAWWDKARSCCVEVSKIGAMVALNSILAEIADKMPHE